MKKGQGNDLVGWTARALQDVKTHNGFTIVKDSKVKVVDYLHLDKHYCVTLIDSIWASSLIVSENDMMLCFDFISSGQPERVPVPKSLAKWYNETKKYTGY